MALERKEIGTLGNLESRLLLQETDASATVDNERVFEGGSGAKFEDVSSQTYKTSIARIRASSNLNPLLIYKTTDGDTSGEWKVDESDTTSVDNTGTVLVNASGQRIKRLFDRTIELKWWDIKSGDEISDKLKSAIGVANALRVRRSNKFSGFADQQICINIPNGVYSLASPINNMTDDLTIAGNGSIIYADAAYPQAEFAFQGNGVDRTGWIFNIYDLIIQDFDYVFDLDNQNRSNGNLLFENIRFMGAELCVQLNCRSSKTVFRECAFQKVRRAIKIIEGDQVEFRGGVVSLADWSDPDTYFIENLSNTTGSHVTLNNFYATPGLVDLSVINDCAWVGLIGNNSLNVNNSRFGGEFNGMALAISEAQVPDFSHHSVIHINDSAISIASEDGIAAAVMLKQIPNEVSIKNCSGLFDVPFLGFHPSVSDPSALLSALTDEKKRRICFDLSGNTMAISSPANSTVFRWGDALPIELEPFNKVYRNEASTEIQGTEIDFRVRGARHKGITADLILTTSNEISGKAVEVHIDNNDQANPRTVSIDGWPFPVGAVNEIPPGGHAHISLQYINGKMDTAIVVYDAPTT